MARSSSSGAPSIRARPRTSPSTSSARRRGRRRVLPGADRRGPCPRGAPHAAPDRRRRHRRGRRPGRGAVRPARHEDDPDDLEGGRARQAVHEHVALHEVRRREPVLHDRGPGRRELFERPRTRSGRTIRAPPTCRPRLRRRPVPVQGHDAARGVHERSLPARPSRDAGQRGAAGLHRVGARAALRRLQGKTIGILGMAFKAESDDARASLSYKLRKLLAWAGATVCAPTRTSRTTGSRRSTASSRTARSSSSACPTGYRGLEVGGKDVVDVWGALGCRHPAVTSPLERPRRAGANGDASIAADLPTIYARRFSDADAPRRGGVWRELTRFLQRYIPESAVGRSTSPAIVARSSTRFARASAGRWTSAMCREHLAPDVQVRPEQRTRPGRVLDAETFDVVFMSNYLEHLGSADEVVEQLRVSAALLKPGGQVGHPAAEHPASSVGRTGTSSITRHR